MDSERFRLTLECSALDNHTAFKDLIAEIFPQGSRIHFCEHENDLWLALNEEATVPSARPWILRGNTVGLYLDPWLCNLNDGDHFVFQRPVDGISAFSTAYIDPGTQELCPRGMYVATNKKPESF
ncbi:MAG: hypothetical protein OXR66_02890 [Candidatus Woesearchaeota archaeon]|nr:hypothetical protein [Candidatus Woesearchaeota archaeon]